MKTLFIEAKYGGKADFSKIQVDELPARVGLVTTVQFVNLVNDVAEYFKKNGKELVVGKGNQVHKCQVLGCEVSAAVSIKDKVDAFLYIGDGRFHPIGVAIETSKPVFVFNPMIGHFYELPSSDVSNYKKRRKAAMLKFLSADNAGILVSTKSGQKHDIKKIDSLEKKYPDKKFYVFAFETLDFNQLENFGFIEAWVNTACPRIEEDVTALNISELK